MNAPSPQQPRHKQRAAKPRNALPLVARTQLSRWVLLHSVGVSVGLSVWAHGMLASLGFIAPLPAPRRLDDEGLKVVLVNAKHALPPKNARALAQTNLDGGGNSEQKDMPTSPLPPETTEQEGDALVQAKRRVEQLEAVQRQLLTQAQNAKAAVNLNTSRAEQGLAQPDTPSDGRDVSDQRRAIARQQAIVERDLREYAERPRKTFIGPRTREYRFAQYVEDWRQRIERVGTLHYPTAARNKVFSLLVSMEIRADGSVQSVDIARSSGNRTVDDAARRIIQLASPFSPFPKDIRRDTDVLVVTRTWTFSSEQMKATDH